MNQLLNPLKLVVFFVLISHVSRGQTPPIANPDTTGLCAGDAVIFNVLANDFDPDLDPLHIDEIITGPEHGEASFDEVGNITYILTTDFVGYDNMLYRVCDNTGQCDIGSFSIGVSAPDDCVWPGDANRDNITNHLDLLAIGLYYDYNGPYRYDRDGTWAPAYCDNWLDTIPEGIFSNPKYADCDGNGTINANDTLPIHTNYNLVHGDYTPPTGGETGPELGVKFFSDSIKVGSSVVIPIDFGTQDLPAANIYGLAFTIEYDADIIVPDSFRVTFNSGWLGTPGDDILYTSRTNAADGYAEAAVSRINHINRSGYGSIGEISFVMEDNIAGKMAATLYDTLTICITQSLVLDNTANKIQVTDACKQLIVYQIETGIDNQYDNGLNIYPNPANETLNITLPNHTEGVLELRNILGQQLCSKNISQSETALQIETSSYANGNYFIVFKSEKTYICTHILIHH